MFKSCFFLLSYLVILIIDNIFKNSLKVKELQRLGINEMSSGESFPEQLHSMNAYLG